MSTTAANIMTRDLYTVAPGATLDTVESELTRRRISAAPVVEHGRLVGLLSRADIVRKLGMEQTLSDMVLDYYRQLEGLLDGSQPSGEAQHLADHALGKQLRQLLVREAMSTMVSTATPSTPVHEIAKAMVDQRVHQIVITEGARPVGIVSALDILGVLARAASNE